MNIKEIMIAIGALGIGFIIGVLIMFFAALSAFKEQDKWENEHSN